MPKEKVTKDTLALVAKLEQIRQAIKFHGRELPWTQRSKYDREISEERRAKWALRIAWLALLVSALGVIFK